MECGLRRVLDHARRELFASGTVEPLLKEETTLQNGHTGVRSIRDLRRAELIEDGTHLVGLIGIEDLEIGLLCRHIWRFKLPVIPNTKQERRALGRIGSLTIRELAGFPDATVGPRETNAISDALRTAPFEIDWAGQQPRVSWR